MLGSHIQAIHAETTSELLLQQSRFEVGSEEQSPSEKTFENLLCWQVSCRKSFGAEVLRDGFCRVLRLSLPSLAPHILHPLMTMPTFSYGLRDALMATFVREVQDARLT